MSCWSRSKVFGRQITLYGSQSMVAEITSTGMLCSHKARLRAHAQENFADNKSYNKMTRDITLTILAKTGKAKHAAGITPELIPTNAHRFSSSVRRDLIPR